MKNKVWISVWLLCGLFMGSVQLFGADGYTFSPVPGWVELAQKEKYPFMEASDSSYGYSVSILDFQADITGVQQLFRHTCVRIDNSQGLENMGQLTFDFDPAYESLSVNFIKVYRDGREISQLERAKFNLLTRESEMEYLMYDGSKTLNAILSDLRIGDVLEYAYTITGSNPVFGNEFYLQRAMQYAMPVAYLNVIIRATESRSLNYIIKTSEVEKTAKNPAADNLRFEKKTEGHTGIYRWTGTNCPAKIYEDDVPDWENVVPVLQVSTMKDWDSIRLWAYNLFAPYSVPSPAVRDFVAVLTKGLTDQKDQIDEIVKFVQRDVRYLGLELGAHAYMPHHPDETLNNRFGDCKDKTLLLQVLLGVIGVESHPVLVDSYKGRFLASQLPCVIDFNHVVLLMKYEGKDYWIDATNSDQAGSFVRYPGLPFGKGLPVTGQTGAVGLIDLPFDLGDLYQTQAVETFTLPAQWDGEGHFEVVCEYFLDHAENMRSYVKGTSSAEMEKQYLEYYGYLFPSIKKKDPVKITETASGDISSTESYIIPEIWGVKKAGEKGDFSYYPMLITDYLTQSKLNTRQDPFALTWPLKFKETVKYVLPPFDWGIEDEVYKKENSFFSFVMDVKVDGNNVAIEYLLETKTDYVPVGKIESYNKDIEEIFDNFEYAFFPQLDKLATFKPGRTDGASGGLGILIFVLVFGVAVLIYNLRRFFANKKTFRNAPPVPEPAAEPGLMDKEAASSEPDPKDEV